MHAQDAGAAEHAGRRPRRPRAPGGRAWPARSTRPRSPCWTRPPAAGSPRSAISGSRRVSSRLCRVFLFRSCPGSRTIRSSATPAVARHLDPVGQERLHLVDDVVVARPAQVRPRRGEAVGDHDRRVGPATTSASSGSRRPLRVVDDEGPGLQRPAGDLGTVGVDREDDVGPGPAPRRRPGRPGRPPPRRSRPARRARRGRRPRRPSPRRPRPPRRRRRRPVERVRGARRRRRSPACG